MRNPFTGLKRLYRVMTKSSVGRLRDDDRIWRSLRDLLANQDGVTQPYQQSVWIYSSVQTIAQNISRCPFKLYKEGSDEDEKVEVTDGELYRLFENPNPYMSKEELIEATEVYLGIRGEAFWVMEGRENVTQVPKEIWCLDPNRFEPIYDKPTGLILGWTYNGTTAVTFSTNEVIHFKRFNPDNPVRGLAPYASVRLSVDQDYYASSYNKSFFQEGATVGGFVTFKEEVGTEAYNRLVNQFEERHKGHQRAHRIGILEGGADFKEVKLSQKDMDFIQLKKLTREEIFGAYKTNAVVLGLYEDIKSYEGIKTAHKTFWQECLIPKISYMEGNLWHRLFSKIDRGMVWAEFDLANVEALQEDFDQKVETAERLFKMGYPINEINRRLDLGMSDVEWGDMGYLPNTLVPADGSGGNNGNNNSNGGGNGDKAIIRATGDKILTMLERCVAMMPVPQTRKEITSEGHTIKLLDGQGQVMEVWTVPKGRLDTGNLTITNGSPEAEEKSEGIIEEAQNTLYWKQYITKQLPLERQFASKLRRFFFEQRKEALENLYLTYSGKDIADLPADEFLTKLADRFVKAGETFGLYDTEAQVRKLRKLIEPVYVIGVQMGAEMVAGELDVTGFRFEPLKEEFLEPMTMRLTNMPRKIVGTVTSGLETTLRQGITQGESVTQLAQRVKGVYNFASSRTMTIARTESASAISGGRNTMMKKQGVKKQRWITARDENVRDSHKRLEGQIAVVGERFKSQDGSTSQLRYPNDSSAPASEVINCRCVCLPVTRDIKPDETIDTEPEWLGDFQKELKMLPKKELKNPYKASLFVDRMAKKHLPPTAYNVRERLWGGWVNDSSSRTVRLMRDSAERLGYSGETHFHGKYLNRNKGRLKKYRAELASTLKEYSRFSGLPVDAITDMIDSIVTFDKTATKLTWERLLREVKPETGGKIVMYRGVWKDFFTLRGLPLPKKGSTGSAKFNSLASWADTKMMADDFGEITLKIEVTPDEVMSSYRTNKSLVGMAEDEMVLLGGKRSVNYTVVDVDTDYIGVDLGVSRTTKEWLTDEEFSWYKKHKAELEQELGEPVTLIADVTPEESNWLGSKG